MEREEINPYESPASVEEHDENENAISVIRRIRELMIACGVIAGYAGAYAISIGTIAATQGRAPNLQESSILHLIGLPIIAGVFVCGIRLKSARNLTGGKTVKDLLKDIGIDTACTGNGGFIQLWSDMVAAEKILKNKPQKFDQKDP